MNDKIIKVNPSQLEAMIHDGVANWFQLGLRSLSTWKGYDYECVIIDKKKYMLAKIKYGI